MTSQQVPHLSIVAVSRNDDHGGDMRARMQHFVDGFIAQCRRHQLQAELVLVEWNPLPGRPPLEQSLQWPADFGPAQVQIVTVPPEIHAGFAHSAQLPLFQMIGKNVGIRRARGRYVLATNVDILFGDELVRYLRDELKAGIMLRVDRYDVPADLPKNVPFECVLADCRKRYFHISTRFGILNLREMRLHGIGRGLVAHLLTAYVGIRILSAQIRHRYQYAWLGRYAWLIRAASSIWIVAYVTVRVAVTFVRDTIEFIGLLARKTWPPHKLPRRSVAGRSISILQRITRVMRELGYIFGNRLGLQRFEKESDRRLRRSRWLHTNACGDFTLLARDDWFRLRGYPEWPIFSWHIDSVFMFAANAHGIQEVALGPRYRIFHMDHSLGSGWSLDGAPHLFARLDQQSIPYLSYDDVCRMQIEFAENPRAAIVNGENWGLADFVLTDREVMPRAPNVGGTKQHASEFLSDCAR